MLKIADFFKKIQNKHSQEFFVRSVVHDAIQKYTQIEVPLEAIVIKSGTLSVNGLSQTAKSQIFIKRVDILKEINLMQTFRVIIDIQ